MPKTFGKKAKQDHLIHLATGRGKLGAIDSIGFHYNTLVKHRKQDPEFAQAEAEVIDMLDAGLVEKAERALENRLDEEEGWAIRYVLENRAPNRWSNRPQMMTEDDLDNKLDHHLDRIKGVLDNGEERA